MITLTHIAAFRDTDTLEKARHGRYADTAKNRRLHRVGQEYGKAGQGDPEADKKPKGQEEQPEQPKKERNGDSVKRELELLEEYKDSIVEKYGEKAYNKKVESLKKEGEDFEQKETVKELKERADKEDAEKAKKEEQGPLAAGKAIIVPDVPNSKKINIDKYLSPKRKKKVDDQVAAIIDNIKAISKDPKEIKEKMSKLYKDEVRALNDDFETLSKADRAEMLYFAMKISNAVHGTNYMLSEPKKGDEDLQGARKENGNNKDILDALIAKGFEKSKKGEPMSFEQADGKSPNPNFGKEGEGEAYTHNCQTCVVVYELRRRGFDVEAKGAYYNGTLDSIQLSIGQNAGRAFVGKEDSWYWEQALPHYPRASKKAYIELMDEFMDRTKEPGRYTFSYKNRGYHSAHILCFERLENGAGFFYDPQTGLTHNPYGSFWESKVDVKYPFNTVIRVDNLDIKPEVAAGLCKF